MEDYSLLLGDSKKEVILEVTAWNNGSNNPTGSGYGFKVSIKDRDQFFKKDWKFIELELEGKPDAIEVSIDRLSFWNDTCRELIHKSIGKWILEFGLAPCKKGNPPRFVLEPLGGNRFLVGKIDICKLNYEKYFKLSNRFTF